jgi:hypothetical protein
MPSLVAGIHVSDPVQPKDVDGQAMMAGRRFPSCLCAELAKTPDLRRTAFALRRVRRTGSGFVIARSDSDEAIQSDAAAWIASLRSQ